MTEHEKTGREKNPQVEDIPLQIRALIPCSSLTIGELLSLDAGAIIRTSRAAGDNVDILVSRHNVAQAELIVIENTLAVRLSEMPEST